MMILSLLILSQASANLVGCPMPKFTSPENVVLTGDKMVLVTHASTAWDGRFTSKAGMDQTVEFGKKHGMPVVYLQDNDPLEIDSEKSYFWSDCNPTYVVESSAGEFDFKVSASHVYTVGGHWDACELKTVEHLVRQWKLSQPTQNLTITYVMDGLYLYGNGVTSDDPYYAEWNQFLDRLSFKNPRASWQMKKLNLLEAWSIINDTEKKNSHSLMTEFLKEQLPPSLSSFPPQYRIELWLDGKLLEVLQDAAPSNTDSPAPILKLEYIPSVYTTADLLIDG